MREVFIVKSAGERRHLSIRPPEGVEISNGCYSGGVITSLFTDGACLEIGDTPAYKLTTPDGKVHDLSSFVRTDKIFEY